MKQHNLIRLIFLVSLLVKYYFVCRHIRHAGGLIGKILTGYMEVPAGLQQRSEQALFDEDSDICINIILIRMFLQDQLIHDDLNRDLTLAFQFAVDGTVDDILLHQIENFRIFFKREGLDILSAAVADGSSNLADTAAGDVEAVEIRGIFRRLMFPGR